MTNKELKTREEKVKEYAYLNACHCIRYGYGKKHWNTCGFKGEEANKIWQQAKSEMAKRFLKQQRERRRAVFI